MSISFFSLCISNSLSLALLSFGFVRPQWNGGSRIFQCPLGIAVSIKVILIVEMAIPTLAFGGGTLLA
jgi:hypothetical protein